MSTFAGSITVRKPVADVFDFATTIANWAVMHPAMAPYLVNPPDHPTVVGETFLETVGRGPLKTKLLWKVTECTRPTRWACQTAPAQGGYFTFAYQLAEIDGGTRVEMRLSYITQTVLAKMADRLFFEKADRQTVEQGVVHLKHAMENGKSACH